LITLSFRPLQSGSAIQVRGAHFRICADGTLRGPDNTIAARYLDGLWYLGHKRHVSFDCAGPIHLRVTNKYGRRERIGPYDSIRTGNGAIFTGDSCLGVHAVRDEPGSELVDVWQEVSFLTDAWPPLNSAADIR
jgi:hypothetical protein